MKLRSKTKISGFKFRTRILGMQPSSPNRTFEHITWPQPTTLFEATSKTSLCQTRPLFRHHLLFYTHHSSLHHPHRQILLPDHHLRFSPPASAPPQDHNSSPVLPSIWT
ncbi:LOW QUALITY PROTEIN: hypothetical protein TorRG33x02_252160 [Trema orientale]|uniref:Uncharacterized protein n=1 Tax=Trema orientale TaxID=63057 RepID=A0A2P5DGJ4_TREOI|nr:LOW QUALITY PROTEIN: hypothetical protein TorRG33x02_252160 [Trema orientale]